VTNLQHRRRPRSGTLVALNLDDYDALALNFAVAPNRLHEVREKLMRNRLSCPLFDTERYQRDIESAYVTMWQSWQDGRPPLSFQVEA
jgi:protein O-GlcNAc transferase